MARRRHITLLMDLVGSYGRALYTGITKYASLMENWGLWTGPSNIWTRPVVRSWEWSVDGAIVFGPWTDVAERAVQSGLPIVNLADVHPDYPVPSLRVDDLAIGRLAAQHLLAQGLKHLGYVGWPDSNYSHVRGEGFRRAAEGRATFHDFVARNPRLDDLSPQRDVPAWPEPELVSWLLAMPKPFGVFAANDERAGNVADAASAAHLAVPEQVAILGTDNDEVVRQRSSIPLSSIELPAARVGYEAAVLLDHLMDGKHPTPRPATDFPPIRVITRQSTEVSAIRDADVAAAIGFIRDHATTPISMADVANAVSMSQRSLELRFRKAIGQSPGELLMRTRLNLAQRLLLETDLKTSVIATRSAFCSLSHFGAMFRQHVGMTPTAYRENCRIS